MVTHLYFTDARIYFFSPSIQAFLLSIPNSLQHHTVPISIPANVHDSPATLITAILISLSR